MIVSIECFLSHTPAITTDTFYAIQKYNVYKMNYRHRRIRLH